MSSLRRKVSVAALALLAALLAAEAIARVAFRGETDTEALRSHREVTLLGSFTRPSADPELGFELVPGTDVRWYGTRVRIHPGEPRRIPADWRADGSPGIRIAVVGDSTPFGWGVEYEDGYCERLRRALEESSGRRIELRDYAVPGYNARQNRITYREHARAWKPQLLLVHYDPNDSAPNRGLPQDGLRPEDGDNWLGSALIKLCWRRLHAAPAALGDAPGEDPAHPNRLFMGYRVAGPEYDEHLEELRLLAELARADGLEPVLFFFDAGLTRESATESSESEGPPAPDAERRRNIRQMRSLGAYRLLHAPLDARASALGFHVVDTYAAAQELIRARGWDSLRPLWLSKEDNHPNAEGHAFLARILYEALTTTAPYRELFTLAEPPK